MSVFDRFLSAMKLNDEPLDDDAYLDDEIDDDFDESGETRLISRDPDDDFDFYGEPSQLPSAEPEREKKTSASRESGSSRFSRSSASKSSRSRRSSGSEGTRSRNSAQVCIIRPRSIEDGSKITDTLLENCTVILNLEGLDLQIAQRVVDYTSGSCYAMHGHLHKISNYIFVITPSSVDISGDFQEALTGAFDVAAF